MLYIKEEMHLEMEKQYVESKSILHDRRKD